MAKKILLILIICCIFTPLPSRADTSAKTLSLHFQDIPIRSALQTLAQFANLNLVASDEIKGNMTLQLTDVPWSEALEVILTANGLSQRTIDHVIYIAPSAQLMDQEKLRAQLAEQQATLSPLSSVLVAVKYSNAVDLAALIQSAKHSLLSPRGHLIVDKRTNALMIQDTSEHLLEIQKLLTALDVPARQVLIEARIVVVDELAKKELGVTLHSIGIGQLGRFDQRSFSIQNMAIDTPIENPAGTLGLAVGTLPNGFALDLELQALESEGQSKLISSPHLTVSNNQEATIEQGQDVPYQTATPTGATQIEFKKAVLGLTVTPQITPDGKVILNLSIHDDHLSPSIGTAGEIPIVATARVSTQVLVNDGQTIVLGGILKHLDSQQERRIPFLGNLPGIGALFRSTATRNERNELMVFVTPKIQVSGV